MLPPSESPAVLADSQIETSPLTKEQLKEIRAGVNERIAELDDANKWDATDLMRIETDDAYVSRFFWHVQQKLGASIDMIVKTILWRHSMNVNSIRSYNLEPSFKQKGSLFMHNRDLDGKRLLVFTTRLHIKGVEDMVEMKRFLIYYLELINRIENGDMLTVLFDCAGCGVKNMDMEFIQFMIKIFQDFYPHALNNIIVLDMPWILDAFWRLIKSWMPQEAVKKIKFVNKKTISKYIAEDQCLVAWGGTDDWEYQFFEELNGGVQNDSISIDSFTENSAAVSPTPVRPPSPISLLEVKPCDVLFFSAVSGADLLSANLSLINISNKHVAFKLMMTSPNKFRVRPRISVISPGESINIYLQTVSTTDIKDINKDKFLIKAMILPSVTLEDDELTRLTKTAKPDAQYRLRCSIESKPSPILDSYHEVKSVTLDPKTSDPKKSSTDHIFDRLDELSMQLTLQGRTMWLLIFINLLILITFYFSEKFSCLTQEVTKSDIIPK